MRTKLKLFTEQYYWFSLIARLSTPKNNNNKSFVT